MNGILMKRLLPKSIKGRVFAFLALLAIIEAGQAVYTVASVDRLGQSLRHIVERPMAAGQATEASLVAFAALREQLVRVGAMTGPLDLDAEATAFALDRQALKTAVQTVARSVEGSSAQSAALELKTDIAAWLDQAEAFVSPIPRRELPVLENVLRAKEAISEKLQDLAAAQAVEANSMAIQSIAAAAGTRTTVALLAALGVTLVIGIGIGLFAMIGQPLSITARRIEALAQGRIDDPVPSEGATEVVAMALALEQLRTGLLDKRTLDTAQAATAERLAATAEALLATAHDLEQDAHKVAALSSDGNQRTEATAQMVETSSARASEASRAVVELDGLARRVSERMLHAQTVADSSMDLATQTAATIEGLNATTDKIADFTSVIGGIAARTNLLALNSTIEAARAGEAGRGFAVVSIEVKDLAAQTAAATDEIAAQLAEAQAVGKNAVAAFTAMRATIDELTQASGEVGRLTGEQRDLAVGLTGLVHQTETANRNVLDSVNELRERVGENGEAASRLLVVAARLSQEAASLRDAAGVARPSKEVA